MEPRFVGRSAQLSELVALLDSALAGRPGLALLTGEPGIGKTRLAAELGRLAQARAVPVLWGRCTDEDGAPPYWPWRGILRAWLAEAGPDMAVTMLTGPAAEVARIAPELPAVPGPAPEGDAGRFALFDAVTGLLSAVASPAGLVVVLDDVQWADPASAALLRHVARETVAGRLLLVVTGRSAELAADPAAGALVADLVRHPAALRRELSGLDASGVAAALAAGLGEPPSPDVVAAVADRTGGNPFFLGEVARLLRDDPAGTRVPAAVRDVVRRRLERLPGPCRDLLAAAAVLGRAVDPARLAAVVGIPAADVLAGLAPAVADGVLDRTPGFAHDLVRETVLADLDPAGRARLHLAVTAALAPGAGDPDVVAELAHHALAALPLGDPAAALGWARTAAATALERCAFEDAAALLRRSADLGPGVVGPAERIALLLDSARAQARAHDVAGVTETCTEVAGLARAAGDRTALGRAALVQEGVSDLVWLRAARPWCEEALLGDAADSALRARLLAHLAVTRLVFGEPEGDAGPAALAMAERLDDPAALVTALRARQFALAGPDGNAGRQHLGDRMLAVAARTGSGDTAMWGHLWRFDALLQAGRTDAAEAELDAVAAAVARVREPLARVHLLRSELAIAFTRGRFADALALNDEVGVICRRAGHEALMMTVRAVGCHAAIYTGAEIEIGDLPRTPRDIGPYRQLMALSIACYHLAHGRRAEAAAWCADLLPPDSPRVPAFMTLVSAALRARVADGLGDPDAAAGVLRVLAPHTALHVVGGAGAMASHGPVPLYLGIAAATCDRTAAAVEHLRAAVGASEAAGARPSAALARYHLARVLRARGRPGDEAEATAAAVASAATADELGMAPLARDLAALGVAEGGLSRREREIAELVGQGLTNRQIAATAHISERTVESHVQHVLAKLGFARRAEIAAWVAGRSR